MASSPAIAFPTLEQLRAAARFGIAMAAITFVAIEAAAALARAARA